jgi:hypothetical protein
VNNFVTSIIRTWVPIAIGVVVTWLQIALEYTVDPETSAMLISFVTGITIAAYYGLIRWLEGRFPQIGWLLGLAKAPGYAAADAPPAQPAPGNNEDGVTDLEGVKILLLASIVIMLFLALVFDTITF